MEGSLAMASNTGVQGIFVSEKERFGAFHTAYWGKLT